MKTRNIICVLLLASAVAALLFSPSEVYVHAAYPPGHLTVSYGVVGGSGSSTAPTLSYTQGGVAGTYTLTTSAVNITADYGSSWSVTPNPLGGSGGSERWQSSEPLSGTVSNQTILFTFYHQYLESLSYNVVGGGSGYPAPLFTAYQFGSPVPETLTTTPAAYWYDSGSSWTVTNPLTGSSSEQWATSQSTSGSVSSSQSLVFSYQHQYLLTMQASPSGAGSTVPALGSSWQSALSIVPISESPGSGETFSSWVGAGPGSYTGPSSSPTITMNGAITEVASFTTLTGTVNSPVITLNPSSGQVGTTVAVSGSGFLASDVACSVSGYPATITMCTVSGGILSATFAVANAPSGPYTITATGTPGSDHAVATFTVTGSQTTVPVVFQQSGLGSDAIGNVLLIDGSWYDYEQLATGVTLSWLIGSTHTVTANTQISGMNGNQYNFEDWSDNGASTHSITVTGAADYVAYYSYPPQSYPPQSYGYEVATTTETVTATSYSTVTQTNELTSTITSVPDPVTVTTSATVTTTATTMDTTAEMLYGSLMAVFFALFLATLVLLVASRSRRFKR